MADLGLQLRGRHLAVECLAMNEDANSVHFSALFMKLLKKASEAASAGARGELRLHFDDGCDRKVDDVLLAGIDDMVARRVSDSVELAPGVHARLVSGDLPLVLSIPDGVEARCGYMRLVSKLGEKAQQVEAHLMPSASFPTDAGGLVVQTRATLTTQRDDVLPALARDLHARLVSRHQKLGFVIGFEDSSTTSACPWSEAGDGFVAGSVVFACGISRRFVGARGVGRWSVSDEELRALVEMCMRPFGLAHAGDVPDVAP